MTNFTIKINNAPVVVDLTKFIGLNPNYITWGDGNLTLDTLLHTYNNNGKYVISGNFEDVTNIENDFTISNLTFIDITNFSSLNSIGNNFLNGCSNLKYIFFEKNDSLNFIGNNFLNGCTNLKFIKVPNQLIELTGWGINISVSSTLKIYGDHKNIKKYEDDEQWNSQGFNKDFIPLGYIYDDGIFQETMIEKAFKSLDFIFSEIDLNVCENIKNAITNNVIAVENQLEEKVDPVTRRVYYNESDLKKTKFILQYKYKFIDNPNNQIQTDYYFICTRLVRAKERIIDIENNIDILRLDLLDQNIFYYKTDEEYNTDISEKKYAIKDVISDYNESTIMKYETKIKSYYDAEGNIVGEYDDPPYFRGSLVFGEINEFNATNINYKGDVNTGFIIEIKAKGVCKNICIYDNDINEALGRREFIKINTNKFPDGKIKSGDYITISTSQGQKYAKLERDGKTIDILKYIDRSSSWLQIFKGDNYFYATADSGKDDGSIFNVKINLIWNELFEGV